MGSSDVENQGCGAAIGAILFIAVLTWIACGFISETMSRIDRLEKLHGNLPACEVNSFKITTDCPLPK